LQSLVGTVTPSGLHFERHHSGVPAIKADTHELWLHGLVSTPLAFSMSDLKRLPAVSRMHFIECAGNTGRDHLGNPGKDPQESHGLLSSSEWTGVPLKILLDAVGVQPQARWIVAEGRDASMLNRSIPLAKALDDVLVAYGQNGEALRPEQGYPVRLLVPGWEGNVSIKWLSRIEVTDQPYMTRDEAAYYTDLLPNGTARRFTFLMEVKSVITSPAGRQRLAAKGIQQISGLAWSGRGKVRQVEISTNGGKTWAIARLEGPIHSKAVTRFTLPWHWDGSPAVLMSRCTDEAGFTQPTRDELVAERGMNATDHYNGIKAWYVHADGGVHHA
jgi:sulfane dehydrogenase subunit SoxC